MPNPLGPRHLLVNTSPVRASALPRRRHHSPTREGGLGRSRRRRRLRPARRHGRGGLRRARGPRRAAVPRPRQRGTSRAADPASDDALATTLETRPFDVRGIHAVPQHAGRRPRFPLRGAGPLAPSGRSPRRMRVEQKEGIRVAAVETAPGFIRPDGKEKVTGTGRYTADLNFTGMAHAKFRYADHSHARILGIDTAKASALPGVVAIVTQDQLPDVRFGSFVQDRLLVRQGRRSLRGRDRRRRRGPDARDRRRGRRPDRDPL